jgi:hypothetical protein
MCMSALEGDMDARVAAGMGPGGGGAGGFASPPPHGAPSGNASPHGVIAGNALPHGVVADLASPPGAAGGGSPAGATSSQSVTAGLASAAALRAFGSAAAVALAPRVIAEAGIAGLSVVLATTLLSGMVITLAWHRSQSGLVLRSSNSM